MEELQAILKFMKLTHDFQRVERMPYVTGQNCKENDVEHSYQLAMLGWYIASSTNLSLDINKVIKYGLLHDLVEVYAGDTYVYDQDQSVHDSKHEREQQALERLKKEFLEFSEMTSLIEQYELRSDEESKFVYALDKIIAPINIYMDNGRSWKEMQVTYNQLIENKQDKVKAHSKVENYFSELTKVLEQGKDHLFYKDKK